MLPKVASFFQLGMCFTLSKKIKIPIINSTVAIKAIMSVEKLPHLIVLHLGPKDLLPFSNIQQWSLI